jgi:chorismate mutase
MIKKILLAILFLVSSFFVGKQVLAVDTTIIDAIAAYNSEINAALAAYNAEINAANTAYNTAYVAAVNAFPPDDAAIQAATTRRNLAKAAAQLKYDGLLVLARNKYDAAIAGTKATAPSAGKSIEDLQKQADSLNKLGIVEPSQLVGRFIKILLAFIGSISLVLYIYAGILWMMASGASERVDKAKKILVWTTLGVVVMLASYMLASFIFKSLETIMKMK